MTVPERYRSAVQAFLDELAAKGQPLPGVDGRCNIMAITRLTGVPVHYFRPSRPLRQLVEGQIEHLGVSDLPASQQPRRPSQPKRVGLPTYGEIKAEGQDHLTATGIADSSMPAYRSALNRWMQCFGLTDADSTEPHLGTKFDHFLREFCGEVRDRVVESRMRRWAEAQRHMADDFALPERFSDALTELIEKSGRSKSSIARAAGLTDSVLATWMHGDVRPSKIEKVRKLEEVLNITPGLLVNRLPSTQLWRNRNEHVPSEWWPEKWRERDAASNHRHKRREVLSSIPKVAFEAGGDELRQAFEKALSYVQAGGSQLEYRQDLVKQLELHYAFRERDWPNELLREWETLKKYKMEPDSFHNEERNSTWAPSTAELGRKLLESFYGYLLLPADPGDPGRSGRGLKQEELTIAWLTIPAVVKGYLGFRRARAGKFNNGISTFVAKWGALLRPQSGWLWQHPELQQRLPQEEQQFIAARDGWQSHCMQAHTELKATIKRLENKGHIDYSRDPFAPILPILDHPEPIKPVLEALRIYRKEIETSERPNELVSSQLATRWRNYLLLSLLIRLPLRAKHWTLMTYRADNTGTLRRSPEGHWQLVIPFEEFKNSRNKKIFTPHSRDRLLILSFEKEPLKQMVPVLELYLERYWPIIAGEGDVLFPSLTGKALKVMGLSDAVRNWTREYLSQDSLRKCGLPGVHAFAPHAFRDIVATHVLKTTGSIELAANILLDSPEIVAKHYARFLPHDRLERVFQAMPVFDTEGS